MIGEMMGSTEDTRETTVNVTKAQQDRFRILAACADTKYADLVEDMLYVFTQALKRHEPRDQRLREIQARYSRAIQILKGASAGASRSGRGKRF